MGAMDAASSACAQVEGNTRDVVVELALLQIDGMTHLRNDGVCVT